MPKQPLVKPSLRLDDSNVTTKLFSVLRMLCNLVGQDAFLKGVSIYLKDHLYGNTTTNDLWSGINKAIHGPDGVAIDVAEMMENWIVKVHVDKFDVYWLLTQWSDFTDRIPGTHCQ